MVHVFFIILKMMLKKFLQVGLEIPSNYISTINMLILIFLTFIHIFLLSSQKWYLMYVELN